ncbi:MAG: hypothetical protein N2314_00760 [Brevinematales bacterium]|nr:hypothetical protein [Brevinematales bacterium]
MELSVWKYFFEAYKKIEWKTQLLENQWPPADLLRLSHQIENEFYYKRFLRRFSFPWGKTFFYQRARKKRPDNFPPLITWENLRIEMAGAYSPGNLLSQTEILGYFEDISSQFPPAIGTPPSPLPPLWRPLNETLKNILAAFQQAPRHPSWLPDLAHLFFDFCACYDLALYLAQLWHYASQNKTLYLRSGQILWWCEKSYSLGVNIEHILSKEGLLATSMPNNQTLYTAFQVWREKMRELRLRLLIDMYQPLFFEENLAIRLSKDEIEIDDLAPLPPTWFSRLFDRLFPPREIPRIATLTHAPSLPQPSQKPLQELIEEVVNRPSPEELDWSNVIFEAKDFIKLRQLLKDFLTMMVNDLSPRYNSQGQLLESKHLFDQFDVPPLMRRLERNRFILKGKIKGLSPLELQEKDDLVIKSTHWLYDRLHDIGERYSFSSAGVRGEQGRHFVEEVQSLFTTAAEEYNDIRKYGTFTQFRFNVRRIFSSMSIQNRYLSHISQIEHVVSQIKEKISSEEIRLLKASSHQNSSPR